MRTSFLILKIFLEKIINNFVIFCFDMEDPIRVGDIERILIPTNKNPLMEKTIDYITNLFPNATYYTLGVVDISGESLLIYSSYSADYLNVLESLEKEAIDEAIEMLKKKNVKLGDSCIAKGFPARTILNYSKKNNINLIILTTSSKIGAEGFKLGSTAKMVIEKSKIPTLLITPVSKNTPVRKIYNPSSGSKYSFRASMLSIRFAKQFNAEVKMLHFGKIKSKNLIDTLDNYAKSLNVKFEVEEYEGENLLKKILDESENYDIIISSRGRRGFSYKFRYFSPELALGKLEKEVIELSKVPIMLINE